MERNDGRLAAFTGILIIRGLRQIGSSTCGSVVLLSPLVTTS